MFMIMMMMMMKIKTHIPCSIKFFPENRAGCEIMWKSILERGRPQMAVCRMRVAYWKTSTLSE